MQAMHAHPRVRNPKGLVQTTDTRARAHAALAAAPELSDPRPMATLEALRAALRADCPQLGDEDGEIAVRPVPTGGWCALARTIDDRSPRAWHCTPDGSAWQIQRLDPASDRLPGAALLRDLRRLAPLLGPGRTARAVDLLAWRPGQRATARVQCDDGSLLFLKLLSRSAFAAACDTFACCPVDQGTVRITRPVRTDARTCALLLPAASGTALSAWLTAGRLPDAASLAAALRTCATLPCRPELPLRTRAHERESTLKMLTRGSEWLPDLQALQAQIAARPLHERAVTALIHTDLHDKQVFLADDGTLTLIDCDGLRRGDPWLDWINLAEHLHLRVRQGTAPPAAAQLADDLLARLPDPPPDRHLLHALVRARLAGLYAQRTGGHDLARHLAVGAQDSLGGG